MKTKALILIAFAAIVTLSFSFAASNRSAILKVKKSEYSQQLNEPVEGFIIEDKF